MTEVRLEAITKHYASAVALGGINLRIPPGELISLLGPSGCGKSTLLRIIAGLTSPTAGRVFFGDRDVTDLDTQHRNAVMVFQSYALWPHMTVKENVGFGLHVRSISRRQRDERITEVLKLVQLESLAGRKPNQLSGGQQQRVALARALAVNPACLLLDEPLSNLDSKLRTEMRGEIRRICKRGGFTTIYVTHDQKEALSIADRIAVMNHGHIAQIGTPAELYRSPANRFVAEFIGQTNVLAGEVIDQTRGLARLRTPLGVVMALCNAKLPDTVTLMVRPEQVRIVQAPLGTRAHPDDQTCAEALNRFAARTVESTFLGEMSEHVLAVNGMTIRALATPPIFDVPDEVMVEFEPEAVVVLRE
jgi:iron(III) transport system ATP-binding protein